MRPMEKLGIVSDRPSPRQPGSWQQELAEAVSDPTELLALGATSIAEVMAFPWERA